MTSLEIHPVKSHKELQAFVKLPWEIYRGDPVWVPPLLVERKQILNRKKNPFFEHAEGEYFLVKKNGKTVGRVTAHIDHLHNQIHKDQTGFFGFFECLDDPLVAKSLLEEAAGWLKSRGMRKIRGPFSFSINEETGLLVKGFEYPPQMLMGHNPPYYASLLESSGLQKVKDLFCWRYDPQKPIPEAPLQIAEEVAKYPGLVIREVDPNRINEELSLIMEVFNSAWQNNWGFVPLTQSEIKKSAKDLKMILEPRVALIAEVDGKPADICLGIPNIHEAIKDLNGSLFPLGFLKLIYRIKTKKIRSGRLMLLGVKKEYRGNVLGGLSILLYVRIHEAAKSLGYGPCELSWTLEDNDRVNMGIEFMGGENYKTYRVYEREI